MIGPVKYYHSKDNPSVATQKQIWKAIEESLKPQPARGFFIPDRRSFVYGAVASIILMFTSVGIYATFRNMIDSSRPQSIRLDSAYESAIQQFERFVPAVGSTVRNQNNILSTRKEQLQYLDAAIQDMKKEMNGSDVSPLKRARIRQLYSMKLGVLQEMIEQGELEL